jgi:hypothetical protein
MTKLLGFWSASALILVLAVSGLSTPVYSQTGVRVEKVRAATCVKPRSCSDRDAIVFVHGIYGDRQTFMNTRTNFDWPESIPASIGGRPVDVYFLRYKSAMISWAKEANPRFYKLSKEVLAAMKPVTNKGYRSIGFIAHSLGGNVAADYIHRTKTRWGHAARAQHAYLITLATPVLGSQVADLAGKLKSILGMNDGLIASLKRNNTFLEMLVEYRQDARLKSSSYGCRPLNLHVAFETKRTGPMYIVNEDSAAKAVRQLAVPPVMGFALNHSDIAKPADRNSNIYKWVQNVLDYEFTRLADWAAARTVLDSRGAPQPAPYEWSFCSNDRLR